MKGEIAQVKEKKPKKPVAKSIIEALRSSGVIEVTESLHVIISVRPIAY